MPSWEDPEVACVWRDMVEGKLDLSEIHQWADLCEIRPELNRYNGEPAIILIKFLDDLKYRYRVQGWVTTEKLKDENINQVDIMEDMMQNIVNALLTAMDIKEKFVSGEEKFESDAISLAFVKGCAKVMELVKDSADIFESYNSTHRYRVQCSVTPPPIVLSSRKADLVEDMMKNIVNTLLNAIDIKNKFENPSELRAEKIEGDAISIAFMKGCSKVKEVVKENADVFYEYDHICI